MKVRIVSEERVLLRYFADARGTIGDWYEVEETEFDLLELLEGAQHELQRRLRKIQRS